MRSASGLLAAALTVTTLLTGCSLVEKFTSSGEHGDQSYTATGPSAQGAVYDDVKLSDATKIVTATPSKVDGTRYRFAAGAAGVGALKAGSMMVVPGVAVRKVVGVSTQGGDTVVETANTTLNEVVTDGTVGWTRKVDWTKVPKAAFEGAAAGMRAEIRPATYRTEPYTGEFSYSGKINGYDVSFSLSPKPAKLEFSLVAKTKNTAIKGEGWISPFETRTRVVYKRGVGRSFETYNRGLKGEAEITWAAVGHGPDQKNSASTLEIPLKFPIPIQAGPIPFTLTLKSALRFAAPLVGESYSGGSYKATWDTDQGIEWSNGKPKPVANVRDSSVKMGHKPAETGAWLPVAFGFGIELPRMELSVAGLPDSFAFVSLDTWAVGHWEGGALVALNGPPCMWAEAEVSAVAGAKLSVLGFELEVKKKLWNKDIRYFKGGTPCGSGKKAAGASGTW